MNIFFLAELRRQFEDSKAKVVFCMDDNLTEVLDALDNLKNITVTLTILNINKINFFSI